MSLSTREVAILVWGSVFLIGAIMMSDVRSSLPGIGEALRKLLVPLVGVVLYLAIVVWCLYLIRFWTPELLKNTIVWVLFSGIAQAFAAFARESEIPTWRGVITKQAKTIVVIEYVLNAYPFSLWAELLLVPALSLVAIVDACARSKQAHASVAKWTGVLLAASGFTILAFAVRNAFLAAEAFSVADALRELFLPLLLSLALLPVVYALFLFSAYEQLFSVLLLSPRKDPSVVQYAKRRLFYRLGIQPSAVRSFLREERTTLASVTTRADVDKLLNRGRQGESTTG